MVRHMGLLPHVHMRRLGGEVWKVWEIHKQLVVSLSDCQLGLLLLTTN